MKRFALAAMLILATSCAKSANEITPQYISPLQYSSYSCSQIEGEMAAVSSRVSEVGGTVNKQASNDNAQMGVGLVLLWPTLFFLDGDTPQATEYARLRGEFDALEKAAIQKDCGLKVVRPIIPEPTVPNKKEESAYPRPNNHILQ